MYSCGLKGLYLVCSLDVGRQLVAAEASDQLRVASTAVTYFNVIIDTAVVLLELKGLKLERHLMVGWGCNPPYAFLARHIL